MKKKSKEDPSYEIFLEQVHPNDRKKVTAAYKRSLEDKKNYSIEFRLLIDDKKIKWIHQQSHTIFDQFGTPLISSGTVQDVTESKHLQIDLEKEKTKYQKLMNHSAEMIFIMDFECNLLDYSRQTAVNLGYSEEEMKKLTLFDWDKKITKEEVKILNDQISKKPITFETIHTRKDGSTINVEVSVVKILIEDKEYIHASCRDITKRKKTEEIIKRQKEEFETIFNLAKEGIAIINFDSRFLNFNKTFMEITGYSREVLLGKCCEDLTAPEDMEKHKEAIATAIKEGSIENIEKSCIVNDGKRVNVNMSISFAA